MIKKGILSLFKYIQQKEGGVYIEYIYTHMRNT